MPSLNQGKYLPLAVESILSQRYPKLEIIVADGGSIDESIPWLSARAEQDNRLRFISQRDGGPAQALNRALALARGTIIGWLNSDDLYTPDCIDRAVTAFQANPNWMMLYGHGEHIDADGVVIEAYPTLPIDQDALQRFEDGCFICQPTVFFKSSMKLLLGKLDERFKTAFDFDYWVRAFQVFPGRVGFVDAVQAQSRLHDECITLRQRRLVCVESMNIISRYLVDLPFHWLLSYADERRANDPVLSLDEIRADLYKIIEELHPQPTEHVLKQLRWFVAHYEYPASPGE
jgi:glycosyltransferase involved in cell wall biosynthesis